MKKISSKIIVFLFFFTLLWSGVGTFGIHAANAWDWEGIILGFVGFPIQLIFVPVLGLLVRLAGLLLDMSVQFTLNSSMLGGGVDTAISTTWAIIRNIFNITFIFVLLYTAIKTIIGSAGLDTKKTIANVIIAALLINFSLFITRVVFDAGNILATVLYNQIIPADSAATFGIGSVLMAKIGMSEIFQWKQLGDSTGGMWTVPFFVASCLQVITLLVLLVSFLYAMLLMVTRTVVIIFLMVLSPVGFMGNILPQISEYSKMWRENLYGQVMVAPIFLLFIYLITLIGKGVTDNLATIKTAAVVNGADDPQQYMIFFKFTLIIVLVIAAVKITKKLSGVVGQAVEGFAKMAAGAAIAAATGGTALLARQTIGRGATSKLNSEYGKDLRAKADTGDRVAQVKLKSLEMASKSTYDARNVKSFGKATSFISDKAGLKIDAGKASGVYSKDGKQTGFAGAQQAEQEKANKAFNDANKAVTGADRVAARDALERRNTAVESNLQGNTAHTTATSEINRMKNEGVANNQEMIAAENEIQQATLDIQTASPAQTEAARKRLKEAEKAKIEKEKELIAKNEEKYKDEIAGQNKTIKEEKRKAELEVEKTLSDDDQKKIARVERARNLAQAMREGKVGIASIIRSKTRNAAIAGKMETQKEKTEAELLREEMQELRRETRDAAKSKTP
jgi:hypothetical protein